MLRRFLNWLFPPMDPESLEELANRYRLVGQRRVMHSDRCWSAALPLYREEAP